MWTPWMHDWHRGGPLCVYVRWVWNVQSASWLRARHVSRRYVRNYLEVHPMFSRPYRLRRSLHHTLHRLHPEIHYVCGREGDPGSHRVRQWNKPGIGPGSCVACKKRKYRSEEMSGSRLGRMDELSVHNGCRLLGGGGGGDGSLTKYMADLELH